MTSAVPVGEGRPTSAFKRAFGSTDDFGRCCGLRRDGHSITPCCVSQGCWLRCWARCGCRGLCSALSSSYPLVNKLFTSGDVSTKYSLKEKVKIVSSCITSTVTAVGKGASCLRSEPPEYIFMIQHADRIFSERELFSESKNCCCISYVWCGIRKTGCAELPGKMVSERRT